MLISLKNFDSEFCMEPNPSAVENADPQLKEVWLHPLAGSQMWSVGSQMRDCM